MPRPALPATLRGAKLPVWFGRCAGTLPQALLLPVVWPGAGGRYVCPGLPRAGSPQRRLRRALAQLDSPAKIAEGRIFAIRGAVRVLLMGGWTPLAKHLLPNRRVP